MARRKCCCICCTILLIVVAVFVAAAVISVRRSRGVAHVPGLPGAIVEKYSEALGLALQFFDVQKCKFFFFFGFFRTCSFEFYFSFLFRSWLFY